MIGLGVGRRHLLAYARDPRCEVAAVCDRSEAVLVQASADCPGARLTTSAAELLADPGLDAVSIATFDDAHYEQTLAALEAGKHVFVEKPLCTRPDELRAVKEAWLRRPGLRLASNLLLRAAPLYRWLRGQAAAGELGDLYAFDGDYLYGRLHKITEGWRKDVEDYSVMLGGGVHLVDLMLWLTGERPVAVAAAGNRISTAGTAFRYADYVSATFAFPSGLVGRVTANFGCMHPHQHSLRVFGTRATVISDDQGPRLLASREPAVPSRPLGLAAEPGSKGDLIPGFIQSIVEGGDTSAQTQHEFDVISACLAADRALSEGGEVDIDYV